MSLQMKGLLWKSVKIWHGYHYEFGVFRFLGHSVYTAAHLQVGD